MPANHPAVRIAPEERLLNLAVGLMATSQGLTKDTVLRSVTGYREQLDAGASKDAIEKMFERDKETLRDLGVPIQTIGDRLDPDDIREARYLIPSSEYELPEDIRFTPAESALLQLAADAWSRSSLSPDAVSGLRKIRSLGLDIDEPILGYAPRLQVDEASFAPLQRAIEQSRAVRFDYRKPGESHARTRRVHPLALIEYEGRWHVCGIDVDASARRTFLLSRITSPVALRRERFDPALRDGAGAHALAELRALAARQSALLEIVPGTEAALRLKRRARPAAQGFHVSYTDANVFADELASYGPEVRVVEPPSLRELVVARLRKTLERHGGADA